MTKRNAKPVVVEPVVEPEIPANKNVGRYFGERVVAGQNTMFELNREWKLTDRQLAAVWCNEWPMAACHYTAHTVRGARRDYNRGRHSNPVAPSTPVPEFRLSDDGVPVAFTSTPAVPSSSS